MRENKTTDLSFEGLKQLIARARAIFPDNPATSFAVVQICGVFLDEYGDQGIPVELDHQLQELAGHFEAVLRRPSDLAVLNELVRHASQIWTNTRR